MTNKLLSQAQMLTVSNIDAPEFPLLPQSLLNTVEEVHILLHLARTHEQTQSGGEASRSVMQA